MKVNSIKFKVSFLYVLIIGVILVASRALLYKNFSDTLYGDFDARLAQKVKALDLTLRAYMDKLGPGDGTFLLAAKRILDFEQGQYSASFRIEEVERKWFPLLDKLDVEQDYIVVSGADGTQLLSSPNAQPGAAELFSPELITSEPGKPRTAGKQRVLGFRFSYKTDSVYIVRLASSLSTLIILLQKRFLEIAVNIPVIMVLVSLLGIILAERILTPVAEITRAAKTISYRNLSRRIDTRNIDEELRYLAEAFNGMISRLEHSFHHISDFSMNVAHELKTPLVIIKSETELVLRGTPGLSRYRKVVEDTGEEVRRILKTIDALLLLAKLEYQPEAYHFEEIELGGLLREAYRYAVGLAGQKSVCVEYKAPRAPVAVSGDPVQLRGLFQNLLNNAVKFTGPDGKIEIRVERAEGIARVQVSDTGTGIEPKNLPKLFTRFFTTDTQAGHGLGLAIARSIARMHDGDITVESAVGKGSVFTVTLPLKKQEV